MSTSFRIVDYNYAAQSTVNILSSSENQNFPASNVGHEFRSKVWRSTGFYVVTASNNKVNFRETSLGPELTATITVGDYSLSNLLLAIKSALESASVNSRTYTVTKSSVSGKFTITGQTYLEILFLTGTNAATSLRSVIGFGSNDYTGLVTYTGPMAALHTEEGVVIDIQTADEIDSVAVLFDHTIGYKLSNAALVYIQASATNDWTSPAYSQAVTVDDNFLSITLFLDTPLEYRFWRVKIVDPQNAYGYVELGTIVLGKYVALARCPDNGFDYTNDDATETQTNKYGNTYADIYPQVKEMTFNFNILTYEQQNILEDVFRRNGNRKPVFVTLDPSENMFDKDHFCIYGRMTDKLVTKHIVKSYFQSGIKIRESL